MRQTYLILLMLCIGLQGCAIGPKPQKVTHEQGDVFLEIKRHFRQGAPLQFSDLLQAMNHPVVYVPNTRKQFEMAAGSAYENITAYAPGLTRCDLLDDQIQVFGIVHSIYHGSLHLTQTVSFYTVFTHNNRVVAMSFYSTRLPDFRRNWSRLE